MNRSLFFGGITAIAAFIIMFFAWLFFYVKVPAGHVGIVYHMVGTKKGPDIEERRPGRYWIGWNDDLFLFPTFTQTHVYEEDQTMVFQDKDGMKVSSDVQVSYSIPADRADEVFRKWRHGPEEITGTVLRREIQSQMINVGSTMSAESIYGAGKEKLLTEVTRRVNQKYNRNGLYVEGLAWSGELVMPDQIRTAIAAKVSASQLTATKNEQVKQAKADADKAIEAARGQASSLLAMRTAEAQGIDLVGQALARNPKMIQFQQVKNWKGDVPKFVGGGAPIPFMNVDQD